MIKIKNAHFHNGKMDEETKKKFLNSFNSQKTKGFRSKAINKVVKIEEETGKTLMGEMNCPSCGVHYKLIQRHKCKGVEK